MSTKNSKANESKGTLPQTGEKDNQEMGQFGLLGLGLLTLTGLFVFRRKEEK
ncbi:LPXTG cell wall anchor domain-containing protein [Paucilactobacillus nenjiangensis]|uniref:LPXTG cell wall anchor domain-containing protein n=1 Tax=Paucilactobacillus nenjiangensis TaxID=1296540 RepID=A0A5P1X658_9LACO|nr:LPXTG cell wall anchor domain-containing protein [Paucilactobacillus nenjiangensis]